MNILLAESNHENATYLELLLEAQGVAVTRVKEAKAVQDLDI